MTAMQENEKLLNEELLLAGESPEMARRLEAHRITRDMDLPEMEFLLRLFGKPILPRGELVAFTGKAKTGKTFILSIIMACCARQEVLAFRRSSANPIHVLWIDTEQSLQSTKEILTDRIVPLVDMEDFPDALYDIINIRLESWEERLKLVLGAIGWYRPDLVILDGIADEVANVNDPVESKMAVEKLLKAATIGKCCIACVIHENKSSMDSSLRGWLGTVLTDKAFEVYSTFKDANCVFSLEQRLTRKHDIADKLYFTVDEHGLPQQVGEPKKVFKKKSKQKTKNEDKKDETEPKPVDGQETNIDFSGE